MYKFLKTKNLPRLSHKEIENVNRLLTSKETDLVIKNLMTKKSPGPDGFTGEFHQTFKQLTSTLLKLFQKIEEEGTLPNSFTRPASP